MKKVVLCIIASLMTVIACASSSTPITETNTVPVATANGYLSEMDLNAVREPAEAEVILAQMSSSAMDLDAAIKAAALKMGANLPAKTEVALVSLASTSAQLSEYIISRLEAALVDDGKLIVLDRANLDRVREEQGFQLSGEVDDKSAKDIGKMLGAGAIVTGSFINLGDVYGLSLKAINMKTAAIAVSYPADIVKSTRIETLLASGGGSAGTGTRTAQTPRTSSGTTTAPVQPTVSAIPAVQTYKVGDTGPAGGIIFYDKGNNSGGWRYLEAAPATTETSAQWRHNSGPLGENVMKAVGETSKEIGNGQINTQTIMRYFSQNGGGFGLAVQVCDELAINGFDDWFLPSQDELSYMYGNLYRKGLGGFRNEWYYSSTIRSGDLYLVRINFANGEPDIGDTAVSRRVRAVRRF
jgi:hypothetical protein